MSEKSDRVAAFAHKLHLEKAFTEELIINQCEQAASFIVLIRRKDDEIERLRSNNETLAVRVAKQEQELKRLAEDYQVQVATIGRLARELAEARQPSTYADYGGDDDVPF